MNTLAGVAGVARACCPFAVAATTCPWTSRSLPSWAAAVVVVVAAEVANACAVVVPGNCNSCPTWVVVGCTAAAEAFAAHRV